MIFESRPRHHVTSNLYLPDGQGPFPGVLVPCGHSDNGKAAETYQRICILLAKNGMARAVLRPDRAGRAIPASGLERQARHPRRRPSTPWRASGHSWSGGSSPATGSGTAFAALIIWRAGPRSIPKRLGCTGNSGGGTMTAYLMALDDRIKVAAPSCYITSLERLFETIGPQDAEQNITGQVAAGMEHADFVTMRAPEADACYPWALATSSTSAGSWDTFREVKLIFGRLGFGERVDLFESDEEHGFTKPRRVAAARWMSRWLLSRDEAFDEPDFPISTDARAAMHADRAGADGLSGGVCF